MRWKSAQCQEKKNHTCGNDPIEIVKLIIKCYGRFPLSCIRMVGTLELHYVLHKTRHQILLFTLSYSYQLLVHDVYDFLDCVVNSASCFFTYNFELRVYGNSFSGNSSGDENGCIQYNGNIFTAHSFVTACC